MSQIQQVGAFMDSIPDGIRNRACAGGCGRVLDQLPVPGLKDTWGPNYCDDCGVKRELAEAAKIEKEKREQRLTELHIPPMYADATIESYSVWAGQVHWGRHEDVDCQKDVKSRASDYSDALDESIATVPPISVFCGGPGTGKNHIAWALVKHAVGKRGLTGLFITLADVLRDLRGAWGDGDGGPSEMQRLKRYRDVGILVLDEVSPHATIAKQITQPLYELVAFREMWLRPTIITTNAKREELPGLLGQPLVSRTVACDGVWSFGDADFRGEIYRRRRQQKSESAA